MGLPAPRIISLCTGVGGLDHGVKRALPGARVVAMCEREAYAIAVLVARIREGKLDDCPIWSDIATFDGRPFRGHCDMVIGSYPCQGESLAGRGLGTLDPRWLWPEFARIIGEVGPEWVFCENVAGHLLRSFRHVRDDLQAMGYRLACGLFTAAEIGAPHKRERLFILAHADDKRQRIGRFRTGESFHSSPIGDTLADPGGAGRQQVAGGPPGDETENGRTGRLEREPNNRHEPERGGPALVHAAGQPERESADSGHALAAGGPARDEPGDRGGGLPEFPPGPGDLDAWRAVLAARPDLAPAVGKPNRRLLRQAQRYLSARTDAERATFKPGVRRVATRIANRVDRLRACGNAVVPACAGLAWRELYAALTLPAAARPCRQSTMFDL